MPCWRTCSDVVSSLVLSIVPFLVTLVSRWESLPPFSPTFPVSRPCHPFHCLPFRSLPLPSCLPSFPSSPAPSSSPCCS